MKIMNEFRSCWREARFSRLQGDSDNNGRRHAALQKLADHYRKFARIGLVMALINPFMMWGLLGRLGLESLTAKLAIVIFGSVYFLTAYVMDKWLYKGISRIDLARMPVVEVCRKSYLYRKRHLQFMAVLFPMAVAYIGILAWILSRNIYAIYGIAAGVAIGLVLGVREFMRFMGEYAEVTDD